MTQIKQLTNRKGISGILLFIYFFVPFGGYSQVGNPGVINVGKDKYNEVGENYAIAVGKDDVVYTGNSNGLIEYLDPDWKLYPLPEKGPVYTLYIDADNRIFVGSFEEFGYFEQNSFGLLDYQSLSSSVSISNQHIKKIVESESKIYFISSSSVFVFDGKELVESLQAPDSFYIEPIDDRQLPIPGKQEAINCFVLTQDSLYIAGTNNNGLYAFDKTGNMQWEISIKNGLTSNTVNALAIDSNNNIWAALDNGVSYISHNSNIRFINPAQNIGRILSALFFDGYLYVATNQGLFYTTADDRDFNFQLIDGLSGQANNLDVFNNKVICSHEKGTFCIKGIVPHLLSDSQEAGIIRQVIIHQQEILIQPAKDCLNIYKRDTNNHWKYSHSIPDFLYPIEELEYDANGNIWLSHPYKGIFKIRLNQDLSETEQVDHFPLKNSRNEYSTNIHLFKIKGRIVFGNSELYYTYDDINNIIIPYQALNENSRKIMDIEKLVGINDNKYWGVSGNGFVEIASTAAGFDIEHFIPFDYFNKKVPEYCRNIAQSNNKVFFFLGDNIALLDLKAPIRKMDSSNTTIRFTSIENFSNTDTVYLDIRQEKLKIIDNHRNNITFHVGLNHFNKGDALYLYKLDGFEEHFSAPTPLSHKEYNRLPAGKYTFHAIAIDHLGNTLSEISYSFRIEPPKYLGLTAILIYLAIFLLFVFFIIYRINKIIRKSNQRVIAEQERLRKEENEQSQMEISNLRSQNLESELHFKSKELANSSFLLINKNNILLEIKDELSKQKKKLGDKYPDTYYDKLIKRIDSGINLDDNWTVFQANFDRIHENFFRNLKETYPELTSNDLKLCALLRLNFSTKDIANFLGNTTRGVDSARYRLRKKLALPSETDIVEFLIQLK